MSAAVVRRRHQPAKQPQADPPRASLTVSGIGDLRKWQASALSSRDLSHAQKFVALALSTFHNTFSGQCNPGLGTLSDRCCLSKTTVVRAIAELERKGWLHVVRSSGGAGKSNQYHLRNG